MLSMYLSAALQRAQYELLEDGDGFYGSIPELQGVWAQGATLEACQAELASVLEDWLLFSISKQMTVPAIDGIELIVREVA